MARVDPLVKSPPQLKMSQKASRPPKYNTTKVPEAIRGVPLGQRKCFRDLSANVHIPRSTLFEMLSTRGKQHGKYGARRHTSALKPHLSDQNMFERCMFALSKRNGSTYKEQYDEIHVDEKWFYLTNDQENYILLDDEPDPLRTVKHKSHIDKVMFLAATAKPRWDPHKKCWFDGKLGIWPFAEKIAAKRSSVNRPAGTLEWKTYNVNRLEYLKMMVEKVIPAIQEKWSAGDQSKTIYIQ